MPCPTTRRKVNLFGRPRLAESVMVCHTAVCYHPRDPTMAKGKRTFQPNNRRRARVHGFRTRMRTRAGRAIVSARRRKGRAKLTA